MPCAAKWCHPRDDQGGAQRWLLVFDDIDRGILIFFDRTEALAVYREARQNWTCHLFTSEED